MYVDDISLYNIIILYLGTFYCDFLQTRTTVCVYIALVSVTYPLFWVRNYIFVFIYPEQTLNL